MADTGNTNRKCGADYEQRAGTFLIEKGYVILQYNFTGRFGEIDVIARDGNYLVFAEVKYRKSTRGGHPLEAVDAPKQRRICRTAAYYCLRHGYGEDTPCRFDVIAILGEEIIHIEDAFPFCYR